MKWITHLPDEFIQIVDKRVADVCIHTQFGLGLLRKGVDLLETN